MAENTLLNYFFESGGAQKASQFGLNRKSRSKRMREIVSILHKHKFLNQLTPEEFRAAFEELGPSFVKIGQTLSTRSEILPKAYCEELTKLQTECDPLPFEQILVALRAIYGERYGKIFESVDPKPLGSASLAQVHKAKLVTGETVAVKIQRPGVKFTMAQDIDIMRGLARKMSRFIKGDAMIDLPAASRYSKRNQGVRQLGRALNAHRMDDASKSGALSRSQTTHDAQVDIDDLPLADDDVARMRVGMKEAVVENLRGVVVQQLLADFRQIVTRSKQLVAMRDVDAFDILHDQHVLARILGVHVR